MFRLLSFSLFVLGLQASATSNLPTPESLLTIDPGKLLRIVHKNLNGWTKIQFKNQKIWSPDTFASQNISDPKAWLSHVQKLGFCEPDKTWNQFPVISVSNRSIDESFQLAVENPQSRTFTKLSYTAMSSYGGKVRTVAYDFTRGGSQVQITCSATNENGETVNISQDIDLTQPQKFQVQQKKDGKLLTL